MTVGRLFSQLDHQGNIIYSSSASNQTNSWTAEILTPLPSPIQARSTVKHRGQTSAHSRIDIEGYLEFFFCGIAINKQYKTEYCFNFTPLLLKV